MSNTNLYKRAEEAQQLAGAATPGPWAKRKDDWNLEVFPVKKVQKPFQAVAVCEIDPDHYATAEGDAALIAAAPSHVALIGELVEALKAAERENKVLRGAVEYYASDSTSYYSDCSGNPGADNGQWAREALAELSANADKGGEG